MTPFGGGCRVANKSTTKGNQVDDFEYDEFVTDWEPLSDLDAWEEEQVFQDRDWEDDAYERHSDWED